MAVKTETCWTKIVETLKNAVNTRGKLNYVKYVFEGIRDDIPEDACPAIVLEPANETEIQHTVPRMKKILLRIYIYCIMQVYDIEKQITGQEGTDNKGIFDFASDVKNVLSGNINLDGNAIRISFPATNYTFVFFPYRTAEITCEIEILTQDTLR